MEKRATRNSSQMSEDYKSPKIFDPSHRNFEIKLHNWIFLVKYFKKVRKRSVFVPEMRGWLEQRATRNSSHMSEDYKSPKIFDPSHRNFEIKLQN